MKCSRCYKTIPLGEEIQKTPFFNAWWWGVETLCMACAKIRDKQKKMYLTIAIGLIALYLLGFLLWFFGMWSRINKVFGK